MVVPVSHRRHLRSAQDGLMTYHGRGRCLVRELSPSLHGHKPGINQLLTFATLPHTRLLNIIYLCASVLWLHVLIISAIDYISIQIIDYNRLLIFRSTSKQQRDCCSQHWKVWS